jgi:hypothetical protein
MPRTDQIQKLFRYAWFSILAECGRDNCGSPTLLFAIRPSTTTDKEFAKELSTWNLSGLSCECGHRIVSLSIAPDSGV